MWDLRSFSCVLALLVLHSLVAWVPSSGAGSSVWKTLDGEFSEILDLYSA